MRHLTTLFFAAMLSLPVWAADYPDFTDLIESTSPAVVKIDTVTPVATGGPQAEIPDSLRRFFDYYQFQQPQPRQRESEAIGSGFIISDDGYVLTNNHVIDGATQITVRLTDRRQYDAEVIGVDPQSDLALLKIEAENLPAAQFADSDDLKVGDWVVAIGSPFNLDFSASAGIVSAIGRSLPDGSGQDYVPFIQTDVAINPGNSGGPLFNMDGDVVGINSQIFTRSGGYMGLSFAIPSSVAMEVVEQLKDTGSVARGYLGVVIREVDQELAEAFGLDRPRGALVNDVTPNSPAARADLRPGDIIVAFDGEPVDYSSDLPHIVGLRMPGESYSVELVRQGRELEIEIRIGQLGSSEVEQASSKQPSQNAVPDSAALGLVVEELDPRMASRLRVDGGILVRAVESGSAGDNAGLSAGDIIVQLGFQSVSSLRDYQDVLAQADSGERLPIRFFRNGNSVYTTIRVD